MFHCSPLKEKFIICQKLISDYSYTFMFLSSRIVIKDHNHHVLVKECKHELLYILEERTHIIFSAIKGALSMI